MSSLRVVKQKERTHCVDFGDAKKWSDRPQWGRKIATIGEVDVCCTML